MKKVILTLSIIATLFSCTTEEIATTEEVTQSENQLAIFTGEYFNNQTYINGDLSNTFDKIWSFTATSVNIAEDLSCENNSGGSFTTAFTFDDTTLYLAIYSDTGISQEEYAYTEDVNGDLTLTLLTGSYIVDYKLTR